MRPGGVCLLIHFYFQHSIIHKVSLIIYDDFNPFSAPKSSFSSIRLQNHHVFSCTNRSLNYARRKALAILRDLLYVLD